MSSNKIDKELKFKIQRCSSIDHIGLTIQCNGDTSKEPCFVCLACEHESKEGCNCSSYIYPMISDGSNIVYGDRRIGTREEFNNLLKFNDELLIYIGSLNKQKKALDLLKQILGYT